MYRKTQISFLEGMSSANQWCVPDEVHDVLAVDFERSLSGLEIDLCSSSNNMSSSVFAVPEMTVRKEESRNILNSATADTFRCLQDISGDVVSNSSTGSEKYQMDRYPVSVVHEKKIRYSQLTDLNCTNSVKRFCINKELEHENFQTTRCRQHSLSAPELRTGNGHFYSSGSMILSQVVQLPSISQPQAFEQASHGQSSPFHCVLLAPTSISTKITEETLTYLNQGQPYEIKIRKAGGMPEKKVLYKSVIHVGFQERRLQYMEKEQIKEWQNQRFGERILEIDLPLSHGVLEVNNCPHNINRCEFLWDPYRDVGVFLKVNCISTEFTPKKHGGEKGVPFRILLETFAQEAPSEKLYIASCQVKVFKPKGADRKHKTDREKMCKRLQADREKYHPQYEYTVFKEPSMSDVWATSNVCYTVPASPTPSSPLSSHCNSPPLENLMDSQKENYVSEGTPATSTTELQEVPEVAAGHVLPLCSDSTSEEVISWLQRNMFENYVKDFTHFTGNDLLNLKRTDLIDICGLANGIRLYNSLHTNTIKPCRTIYVRLPSQQAFYAIYLETTKASEFFAKIKSVCGISSDYMYEIFVTGPSGIHVIVTDEVVLNMAQETLFIVEFMSGDRFEEPYGILLKQLIN